MSGDGLPQQRLSFANRKLNLSEHLPPHPERAAILETLIRDRLAEPTSSAREDEILSSIRSRSAE